MRLAIAAAVFAGLLASRAVDALAAPRLIPAWLAMVPLVALGVLIGLLYAALRGGRRRGASAFVVMRGRVKCPSCEYLLDLDDRHCAQCGTAILQVKKRIPCERCRARNWEDDLFCRQCGLPREVAQE
jgi:hypothetical protein